MTEADVANPAHGGVYTTRPNLLRVAVAGLGWMLVMSTTLAPERARADTDECLAAHEQAQRLRMHGQYTGAREQLLVCAQRDCPAPVSADCIDWLAEVEDSLPSVVFAVVDDRGQDLVDVRVSHAGSVLTKRIDGRALELDPAVYTMRFEATGYLPEERVVTVREGQKQRLIRVALTRAPAAPDDREDLGGASQSPHDRERTDGVRKSAKRTRYRISYALAAGALASLGAGVGLAVTGKRELNRLEGQCGDTGCAKAQRARGRRLYITADVMFGVAAGLATTAAWIAIATRRHAQRPHDRGQAWLTPWLSPHVAGLQGGAHFEALTR